MNHLNLEEKLLVEALNEGDETAFEELYYRYSERLLEYLKRLVKLNEVAEEIIQETFLKIWTKRAQIDSDKSFKSYLCKIASNKAYDFFRKAARDTALQHAVICTNSPDLCPIEDNLYKKENMALLHGTIQELPPKRREVFQLVRMEEKSYSEVSNLLHISTATINDHIVKATKFIHKKLINYDIVSIGIILFLWTGSQ